MNVIKMMILLIFILSNTINIIAEDKCYPYFMTVNEYHEFEEIVIIDDVSYNNVKHCLHWWSYKASAGDEPIDVKTDWCTDHPFELLPAGIIGGIQQYISANDFETTASNALNQWNIITGYDHNIFTIDNSAESSSEAIFIEVVQIWQDNITVQAYTNLALEEYDEDNNYWGIFYENIVYSPAQP